MAEIKIEKKKPVWPWIIAILVILGIVYYFFVYANDTNDDTDLIDDTVEQIDDTTGYDTTNEDATTLYTGTYGDVKKEDAVSDYNMHIEKIDRIGTDVMYTNTAILKLIDAVEERAIALNIDVSSQLEQAREEAKKTSSENKTATVVKKSGEHISNALEKIQQDNFPDLSEEIKSLKNVLAEINPELSLTEQKGEVTAFLNNSGKILSQLD